MRLVLTDGQRELALARGAGHPTNEFILSVGYAIWEAIPRAYRARIGTETAKIKIRDDEDQEEIYFVDEGWPPNLRLSGTRARINTWSCWQCKRQYGSRCGTCLGKQVCFQCNPCAEPFRDSSGVFHPVASRTAGFQLPFLFRAPDLMPKRLASLSLSLETALTSIEIRSTKMFKYAL